MGPVSSAPQGIVEQFFQPTEGRAPSDKAGKSTSPVTNMPARKTDGTQPAQLSQATKQLQSAVQRIESGRSQRAKEASMWRDDPRRLQQFKDW